MATDVSTASDIETAFADVRSRLAEVIVGLDKESTEVIQGSFLYDPNVDIDSVVLGPGLKEEILASVINFEKFRK